MALVVLAEPVVVVVVITVGETLKVALILVLFTLKLF